MSLYAILGEIFLILILIVPILLLVAMIFGLILVTSKRRLFPRFTYIVLTTLSQPARTLLNLLHIDPIILNEVVIALINAFTDEEYKKTPPDRRMLFLPQCLRSLDCPAKTSSDEGIVCLGCGRCAIKSIVEFSRDLGVEVYLVPGGGFVRRIIRNKKPGAVAGVACAIELYDMMRTLTRKGVPAQGVLLAKSGCIETLVDWNEVKSLLAA